MTMGICMLVRVRIVCTCFKCMHSRLSVAPVRSVVVVHTRTPGAVLGVVHVCVVVRTPAAGRGSTCV